MRIHYNNKMGFESRRFLIFLMISIFSTHSFGKKATNVFFMGKDFCPYYCSKKRPGLLGELYQLILRGNSDYYGAMLFTEKPKFKIGENEIKLYYKFDKREKGFLYSDKSLASIKMCFYGKAEPYKNIRDIRKKKIAFKAYSYLDKHFSDFYKDYKKNVYYIDSYAPDLNTETLLKWSSKKKYDWVLLNEDDVNFKFRNYAKTLGVKNLGCLKGSASLYFAIDKDHKDAKNTKLFFDQKINQLINEGYYKRLINYYKLPHQF